MEYQEESSNRPFIVASVALGGLFVAGLVSLGLYAFKIKPAQASASATQIAEINISNTQVAVYAEATSVAQVAAVVSSDTEQQARLASSLGSDANEAAIDSVEVLPAEPIVVQAQVSSPNSESSIVETDNKVIASSSTSDLNNDANTSLVSVDMAEGVASPETLPDTGFADEVGLPVLVLAMFVLISVVIVTRSVRRFANG
tara:strand:+ start:6809 stop:7411 length:603 start_codon:yes stop_codon:yes gene_type:complete